MDDDAATKRSRCRGASFALAVGAVSWAWSEVGFWAHFRVDDNAIVWVLTLLLYTLVAYVVLRILRRSPVTGIASVFIVGATYGWLVEGTIANTVYLALPFSIVWTALAWHALLTVVVGWYALPRLLQRGGLQAVGWCALLGLAWGCWAVGWWSATPDSGQVRATAQPISYAVFVVLVTGVAALGYGIQFSHRPGPGELAGRWPLRVVVGLLLLWSIPVVVLPLPWAPVVLALLLWLALSTLQRLRSQPFSGGDDILGWRFGVPWRRLPPLAATPIVAWIAYVVANPLSGRPTGRGPLYDGFLAATVVLCLAGSCLLAWSLWCAWSPRART